MSYVNEEQQVHPGVTLTGSEREQQPITALASPPSARQRLGCQLLAGRAKIIRKVRPKLQSLAHFMDSDIVADNMPPTAKIGRAHV